MVDFKALGDNLKETIGNASNIVSDMKDDARQKLVATVNDLGNIIPIIAQTGYNLMAVDMEISIPPGVVMQFEKVKELPREAIDKILAENEGKDMLKLIVTSLVAADDLHKKIKLGSLVFAKISIGLTFPPTVIISFVRK